MKAEERTGEQKMAISKEEYARLTQRFAPPSPLWKDCAKAFLCGGALCALSQLALELLQKAGADEETGRLLVMLALIAGTAVCTALGIFDKLAKHAGEGAAVPITGFGWALAKGTKQAVDEQGWRGILQGPLASASVGVMAAVLSALLVSAVARPKEK